MLLAIANFTSLMISVITDRAYTFLSYYILNTIINISISTNMLVITIIYYLSFSTDNSIVALYNSNLPDLISIQINKM